MSEQPELLTSAPHDGHVRGSRVTWFTELVRLEIVLWSRLDQRLREKHDLPLASFETLYFISRARQRRLRVGELAHALRITVGGTSKVVDRVERAGLVRREADSGDRRVSSVALTQAGTRALTIATTTYEAELAHALDGVLTIEEQRLVQELVRRMLAASADESPDQPPDEEAQA
jgi:DNA-binding MarR family transcriptional regulator